LMDPGCDPSGVVELAMAGDADGETGHEGGLEHR
jgi:hypothetical protein